MCVYNDRLETNLYIFIKVNSNVMPLHVIPTAMDVFTREW